MSATKLTPESRRHDLDALRAVAMLLGIGLHAAISFIPGDGFWAVKDTQTNEFFGLLMASIHGFRMPLFFLISGFFTMMLFRKRGLRSLLGHRFKRIFLPMVLALFTIIPTVWAVSFYVGLKIKSKTAGPVSAEQIDIHLAAALGKTDRLAGLLDEGVDVDSRNHDGVTPLMVAALFGRPEAAELLIDRGADSTIKGNKGETVRDLLKVDQGTTQWIGGMIGVEVDSSAMDEGRHEIAAILPSRAIGTIAAKSETPVSREQPMAAAVGLIAAGLYFPLFGHLWFLWFLCWLVVGFAVCISVGRAVSIPRAPTWFTLSPVSLLWLVPLTMIPQSFMGLQGQAFGPDTSIGLIPMPAVLAYYAIFFAFGALYFDARDDEGKLGSRWAITLPFAALVLLPIGLATSQMSEGIGRSVSVFVQATFVWLVSFGMMGIFRRYLSSESKAMRYLSDSSYWLYLAHIPLVIWLQYVVRDYDVSPLLKFPIVCVVAGVMLLASYHWFVRFTPIGTLLNGKRSRKPREVIVEAELGEDDQRTPDPATLRLSGGRMAS
ncbi:acyltransferase family protein [Planctomycetes bacterium TBK1r]|uniref:Glucans biosynthesis protein C n=1 Tax=Stieleria magnilauensis TaxID=2527963 RepID=A0ABX5XQK5_9BACT|nr:Glucans biosynthesis protein C [Planctomycetes bacterium TBK1r]